MNLLAGAAVVMVVTAVCVSAMLLVRRRAPDGSRFADGDRASGVFGVIATGFSVLLGFIIFLAFTTYDASRSAAEEEAVLLGQQVETAQFFPDDLAAELTGELVCYGRSVVNGEWDRMRSGTLADQISPWSAELFGTIRAYRPHGDTAQSAYDRWMDQTLAREQARRDRVHAVEGVVPGPLWVVLFFVSGLIVLFLLFFADPAEGAVTQALLMGAVVAILTSLLLLLAFLNRPYQNGIGGVRPDSMQRTLELVSDTIDEGLLQVTPPCDAAGETS